MLMSPLRIRQEKREKKMYSRKSFLKTFKIFLFAEDLQTQKFLKQKSLQVSPTWDEYLNFIDENIKLKLKTNAT